MSFLLRLSADPGASEAMRWAAGLLTHAVHVLCWTTVAALLVRYAVPSASRACVLWRLALMGPLATTVVSMVLPFVPPWSVTYMLANEAPALGVTLLKQHPQAAASMTWYAARGFLASLLSGLLIAAVCIGLFRFVAASIRLTRTLRDRTPVRDPRLLARFAGIQQQIRLSRVVLTESARISVPLVLGRREVCIPQLALDAFADDEVDAIFAHELAHLERADGLWFPAIGLVEAVLWVQPLNRWIAARWRQAAELACDDRAIELTGAPMALARAIARVAEQAQHARTPLAPAMATAGSSVQRVRRLLHLRGLQTRGADAQRAARTARWPIVCLALIGIASPSVGIAREPRRPVRVPPRASPMAAAANETPHERRQREERLQRELDRLLQHATLGARNPLTIAELRRTLRALRSDPSFVPSEAHARTP